MQTLHFLLNAIKKTHRITSQTTMMIRRKIGDMRTTRNNTQQPSSALNQVPAIGLKEVTHWIVSVRHGTAPHRNHETHWIGTLRLDRTSVAMDSSSDKDIVLAVFCNELEK
ncbi:hypothetical protein PR048_013408 [Dryococelus australis]|uniref:Uncharacterized protein n=1 Tax=Dryococelus australis TaxID=614101 RepID=A0ABQ9HS29_9NEOP|nr:hypothetical protein PR048_013408 [Dryococelus australis]